MKSNEFLMKLMLKAHWSILIDPDNFQHGSSFLSQAIPFASDPQDQRLYPDDKDATGIPPWQLEKSTIYRWLMMIVPLIECKIHENATICKHLFDDFPTQADLFLDYL